MHYGDTGIFRIPVSFIPQGKIAEPIPEYCPESADVYSGSLKLISRPEGTML
ncbi:MAG TPA: hypothetical protein VKM35_06150 [Arenimonas sp.]|uniref:hypothetical protein n=1 Tax=Arenimonas sp. TaxID=1872635 RepID=UPI002D02DE36|nr:hypothetical protein [Arenimonas sp.]HMB56773.1 hypothetical protein [Arenimonas sp.]